MTTNVTARDVHLNQRNVLPLMQYLLHKSTPVTKESTPVCIETAVRGFTLA